MAGDSCRAAVQGSSNLIGIYCAAAQQQQLLPQQQQQQHRQQFEAIQEQQQQIAMGTCKCPRALVLPLWHGWVRGRGGEGRISKSLLRKIFLSSILLRSVAFVAWPAAAISVSVNVICERSVENANETEAATNCGNLAISLHCQPGLPHTHTHANENCSPALIEPKPAAMRPQPVPAWAANSPVHLVSSSRTRTATLSPLFLSPSPSLHLSLFAVLLCGSAAQTQNKFRRICTKLFARPFAITTFNQITNTFRAKTILIALKKTAKNTLGYIDDAAHLP